MAEKTQIVIKYLLFIIFNILHILIKLGIFIKE